ncbi:MAG: outer membrane protein transport protein [Mariprofundaceae bacterium]
MRRYLWILLMLGGLLPLPKADAAALAGLDMSASAAGAGNAFTATADDPSAMHYNPAGLAWQPGVNLAFSGALRSENQSAKQSAAQGTPFNNQNLANLSGLYGNWMPKGSKWGVGFALDLPYALNTGWGDAFGGAAKITTIDVLHTAVDAVYALDSSLAVAVGGDWYVAQGDINSATTTFNGTDNVTFGGHVSVLWHPRPAWSLGALLRSGATLNLSGTATGAVNGEANVNVPLPDVLRLGAMHVFSDAIRLEVDASWSRWSSLNDLDVVGATTERNTLNMADSFSLMTGLTWFWREKTVLRFGYAFDQAASKDTAFNARIVDANTHRISLGAGGEIAGLHLDLAYVYAYAPSRTISGSGVFDGQYRTRRQSLALSVAKHF